MARTKRGFNPVGFFIKTVLILGSAFVVMLFALALMGASPWLYPTYKAGMEDALAEVTGYDARIDELVRISFFPVIAAEVKEISFSRRGAAEGALPVARAARASVEVGFFDLLAGQQVLRGLAVDGLAAGAGVFTPRALRVDSAALTQDPAGLPEGSAGGLVARGSYGPHAFVLATGMDVSGPAGQEVFSALGKVPMVFTLGEPGAPLLSLRGAAENGFGRTILRDVVLSLEGRTLVKSQKMAVSIPGRGRVELAGDVSFGQSALDPDLALNAAAARPKVEGSVRGSVLRVADGQALGAGFGKIVEIWGTAPAQPQPVEEGSAGPSPADDFAALRGVDADVSVALDTLDLGGAVLEQVKADVALADGVLKAPFAGVLYGGALSGTLVLNTKAAPAQGELNAEMKGLDYASVLGRKGDVEGRADTRIALKAQGDTVPGMIRTLAGEVVIVSGPAKLGQAQAGSPAFRLLQAAVPGFAPGEDLTLNCAVADAEVKGGVAEARALFADGPRLALIGSGTYDIARDRLALIVAPRAKGTPLGGMAPSVEVGGPIAAPTFRPNVASAAVKLGGLAVGRFLDQQAGDILLNEVAPALDKAQGVDAGALPDCGAYVGR